MHCFLVHILRIILTCNCSTYSDKNMEITHQGNVGQLLNDDEFCFVKATKNIGKLSFILSFVYSITAKILT